MRLTEDPPNAYGKLQGMQRRPLFPAWSERGPSETAQHKQRLGLECGHGDSPRVIWGRQ